MAYIIKHNLPAGNIHAPSEVKTARMARRVFMSLAETLSKKFQIQVLFRNKPMRGTVQVEIDGFFYYVELYRQK